MLTEATSYTVGSCVRDSEGNVAALIFVSCQDPATAGVVRHSTQTLVLILLVTLAVMLIISFILSQHITRPIKNTRRRQRNLASGNFDVRVPEDNHCYEIDEAGGLVQQYGERPRSARGADARLYLECQP